jgi:hypothetical protein
MLGNSDCTLYCCTPDLIQCIYIYRISLKLHVRAFKDIHASDIINNNSDKPFCAIFLRRICAVYLRRLFAPFICADFLSGRIFMLEVFPCQTSHMRLPGLLVCFLPCDEHIFCAEFAPFICAVYLRRFQIGPYIYARGISLSEKSHETSCALGVFFYLMMGTSFAPNLRRKCARVDLHLERPQN